MKMLQIPTEIVGPLHINSDTFQGVFEVPLATFETPLWPSVSRGALATRVDGGINTTLVKSSMTRSILLEADSVQAALEVVNFSEDNFETLQKEVRKTSQYAQLKSIHTEVVGNLLYMRLSFDTGDAAGHNMATKAAEAIQTYLLKEKPFLRYGSISANYCVDKKVSAINGLLGRGKYVVAEAMITEKTCQKVLKTTPQKIVKLNYQKNLLGSTLGGSLRSANAHFANMLLAFYLATGQDAANIVEGSQGIVHTEIREQNLYFSVTLPNIIVGTVGNGKQHPDVKENLLLLNCLAENEVGMNAHKLAQIAAATVLCGELSLLAAQTNPGELMRSHELYERPKN